MSEWISVDDKLPEKGRMVLAYRDGWDIDFDYMSASGRWYKDFSPEFPVTHWMPLPEPPKED